MKTMTVEQLEKNDFYVIGDNDRKEYYPAIIRIAKDESHIAYSREKLEKCFMLVNDWTLDEAIEWIEYNVDRALPYYGSRAPVILDSNFISSRNKTYNSVKVLDF